MASRIMLVHLDRAVRGEDETRRLRDQLPLVGVHSTVGQPNQALAIRVEADNRKTAEILAYDLVTAVIGRDDVVRVTGDDDVMQDRQVMFWLLAARQHLRAWEIALAGYLRLTLAKSAGADSVVWEVQLSHHVALNSGYQLVRALANAEDRYLPMPPEMATELSMLRNLHEHWDEQWPAFYDVRNPGPLVRSGRDFAALHPARSPYSALNWSSRSGPQLGPGLLASELHTYLGALLEEVLHAAPNLERFTAPLDPSPWAGGGRSGENWWPEPKA